LLIRASAGSRGRVRTWTLEKRGWRTRVVSSPARSAATSAAVPIEPDHGHDVAVEVPLPEQPPRGAHRLARLQVVPHPSTAAAGADAIELPSSYCRASPAPRRSGPRGAPSSSHRRDDVSVEMIGIGRLRSVVGGARGSPAVAIVTGSIVRGGCFFCGRGGRSDGGGVWALPDDAGKPIALLVTTCAAEPAAASSTRSPAREQAWTLCMKTQRFFLIHHQHRRPGWLVNSCAPD
jgi:hypothetical protein